MFINKTNYDRTNKVLKIEIAGKGNISYQQGRQLAEKMYREVWNTNKLVDCNDYAVIVSMNSLAIGNINIQLRQNDSLLKSESFFRVSTGNIILIYQALILLKFQAWLYLMKSIKSLVDLYSWL